MTAQLLLFGEDTFTPRLATSTRRGGKSPAVIDALLAAGDGQA